MKAILIEDSPDDAFLLERALAEGGIHAEYHRVETLEELEALLDESVFDFIISDYALPQFSVSAGLQTVRERGLDLPFIVVSGRYGEEKAVETMRAGAHDYVPKDRLVRLAPAVDRELREAQGRQERRELERYLGLSDPLRLFGRLASSLAHDLNNPLTFLHAGLGVLAQRLAGLGAPEYGVPRDQLARLGDLVDKLIVGAEKVARTTADFRALGAAEDEAPQQVAIDPIVEHCVKLVQLEFRRRAQVTCDLGSAASSEVKVGRLKQALVNVLVHVAHSLPPAPRSPLDPHDVRIQTRTDAGGEARIELVVRRGHVPGDAARAPAQALEAADYGLFMGRRILEMIGGGLTVTTEPGTGIERLVLTVPPRPPVATPGAVREI